ncbi:MAG: hypothetical protein EKK39_11810 [Sphingobacteriales bacterium]|nr:MAG: hypothetical protein EKK39_11810 [Sphingobacteriales bacterium]
MKALDYILYITHGFLLIVKKLNNEDIEGRSKNVLAIIVFLFSLLLSSIAYGIGISNKLISYNKTRIFVFGIALFFIVRYLIFKRYKNQYNEVIETLTNKFSYSKTRIVLSFLIFWITPIFLLWIGIIILRQSIYQL